MTKYIFVTGGVVSSIGKGVSASGIAALLESMNLKVNIMKLDPYVNVDAGTISPFQHGEVFVTEDGGETDLDLGHYERFISTKMKKENNLTAGRVYLNVIKKERNGDFLGSTIQVIPHITDEIKSKIKKNGRNFDILVVEIGGTVGDIESLPFLESIRQLRIELTSQKTLFVHITLLPYIKSAGEVKTKPTQHSVKELRSIGIQPDIILCRTSSILNKNNLEKISMFTNVEKNCVICLKDLDNIYQIPIELKNQSLDKIISNKLGLKKVKTPSLGPWEKIIKNKNSINKTIRVAIIGKYIELHDAYKSLSESLIHAGLIEKTKIDLLFINSEEINNSKTLTSYNIDGIVIPGGFGDRGIEGKINAVKFSRENNIPFLGICLGMQVAVIEFCRNVLGLTNSNSTEFDNNTQNPVICLMERWLDEAKSKLVSYSKTSKKGGTMRLGKQKTCIIKNSLAKKIYKKNIIEERHRHRYEINPDYINFLEKNGMIISGRCYNTPEISEIIELPNHNWFLGTQFHPEFTSSPINGHPLFIDFIKKINSLKKN